MNGKKKYRPRTADEILEMKMKAFGAVSIVGPKAVGKSTTAGQIGKTIIAFEDEETGPINIFYAKNDIKKLFDNPTPILFDEWKDAPEVFVAVRSKVDKLQEKGLYILTDSTTIDYDKLPHTGTGRISKLKMYPMSLYESGDGGGEISLKSLFDDPSSFASGYSEMTFDRLAYLIARGGWPASLDIDEKASLLIAKDLYRQIVEVDISHVDGVKRDPKIARKILRSYARNLIMPAKTSTILNDSGTGGAPLNESVYYDYRKALESLYIIEDIESWSSSIRSRSNMVSTPKRNLVDPSLAMAALGIGPERLLRDINYFGILFESLAMRDLRAYSDGEEESVSYYRDRYGLEADAVYTLEDGRYALIEVKLGIDAVDAAASHLNDIEKKISIGLAKNDSASKELLMPSFKLIITGIGPCYRRDDGIYVVPLDMLKK